MSSPCGNYLASITGANRRSGRGGLPHPVPRTAPPAGMTDGISRGERAKGEKRRTEGVVPLVVVTNAGDVSTGRWEWVSGERESESMTGFNAPATCQACQVECSRRV